MQTSTTTTTTPTRSLTIGDVTFVDVEIDEYVWEASARVSPASNSAYHRMGKPNWWARIGDRFIKIDRVGCDEPCPDIDLHDVIRAWGHRIEANADMVIGFGPRGHLDARRWTFSVRYIRELGLTSGS